jgi:hypothetical protein
VNRSTRSRRSALRRAALAVGACGALAVSTAPGSTASAASAAPVGRFLDWAAPDKATLRPGLVLETQGAECTGNFVFNDAKGRVYLGQAAHCSSQGEPTDFNGCKDKSYPLGTKVAVVGSQVSGVLAYSSWLTMQSVKEKDKFACAENDLALVQIPDDVRDVVNPSVPYYGGPHGLNKTGAAVGEAVYSYGNSPLRMSIGLLAPKYGVVVEQVSGGWSYLTYFTTPGIPGDSGSAVLDSAGRALGVLSSLSISPAPASNGVSDIGRMLAYAQGHSGIEGLQLVDGTTAFSKG